MLSRAVLLALLSLLAAAPAASADTTWLCRPGMAANPCEPPLTTTRYDPYDQAGAVTTSRTSARKVDCFYVYPTVSDQPGPLADRSIDPEQRSIALYQTSRYSQLCRVFAPVYRQATVASLSNGSLTPALVKRAYGDVLAAWKDYLRNDNEGRGVVLIGHSQGAYHLQELVRTQIDPEASERRRIVSALLLGGNVTVRKGSDRGGVFRNVRACRSPQQLGCVVAFSAYNATPPADSLFGRPGNRFATIFGHPSGSRYEALCTNPAALGSSRSVPLDTIVPAAPFAPGTLISAGIGLLGFPIPKADTTYLQSRGLFTGRCSQAGGADVLRIASTPGTPVPKASPDPTWGLHLLDANVALGDLVKLVRTQVAAYARRS